MDRRVTPARPDLAAEFLRGKVEAARFATGTPREIIASSAPLRRSPSHGSPLETEALMGERVMVYETDGEGWGWGQLERDHYVGFLPAGALATPGPSPTHKVAVPRTLMFSAPDIKSNPVDALSFGATVVVLDETQNLARTRGDFYIPLNHLAPVLNLERDPVVVADKFLHAPYLWGGKTSCGVDCSGLVQIAMQACGIECPRDSDMQEASLGEALPTSHENVLRGDLLFWPGHVAMVRDAKSIIHANAHAMAVAIEPLEIALARIAQSGAPLRSVRRVPTSS